MVTGVENWLYFQVTISAKMGLFPRNDQNSFARSLLKVIDIPFIWYPATCPNSEYRGLTPKRTENPMLEVEQWTNFHFSNINMHPFGGALFLHLIFP